MSLIFDRSMRSFDVDGRMHIERSNISKANVCGYLGKEISNWEELGLDPERVYDLYRDPAELEKAAPTYHNIPLLRRHIAVTAESPNTEDIVGTVSDVRFDAPYLTASLAVWDAEAIRLIESEAQSELSCGYYFIADMTPGVTADGVPFSGTMRSLSANHVALVSRGRAGSDVSVADQSLKECSFMKAYPKLVTVLAPYLSPTADRAKLALALDAELENQEEAAADETNEFYGCTKDEWEAKSAEDRKTARDAWKKAKDKKATKDAALASDAMRTQLLGAAKAAEAVRPIVGAIALDSLDSAEKIFAFALKHIGVKTDGIHSSALASVFEAHAGARRRGAIAVDARGWRSEFSLDSILTERPSMALDGGGGHVSISDIWKISEASA